jgi:hypothetical protein
MTGSKTVTGTFCPEKVQIGLDLVYCVHLNQSMNHPISSKFPRGISPRFPDAAEPPLQQNGDEYHVLHTNMSRSAGVISQDAGVVRKKRICCGTIISARKYLWEAQFDHENAPAATAVHNTFHQPQTYKYV